MAHSEELIRELEKKADVVRKNIITIFEASTIGHVGGTMSIVDIVTALYFHHLKLDLEDCDCPDRDRVSGRRDQRRDMGTAGGVLPDGRW